MAEILKFYLIYLKVQTYDEEKSTKSITSASEKRNYQIIIPVLFICLILSIRYPLLFLLFCFVFANFKPCGYGNKESILQIHLVFNHFVYA